VDIDFGWMKVNHHLHLCANDALAWKAVLCAVNLLKQNDYKYQYSLGHGKWPLIYTWCQVDTFTYFRLRKEMVEFCCVQSSLVLFTNWRYVKYKKRNFPMGVIPLLWAGYLSRYSD
jgi:hypothetical protein